ncbi:MAG TPA: ABC transporter permease [Thermotogota bacterium]|nr:ABC transporter permease [Thermotogota bacterium]HRW35534.1 ABC transporter permease [Thermotogota bacterium]
MKRYIRYFKTFQQYFFLLTVLVKTDIKKKYKGSFLGVLWSLINPLLDMIVMTIVFSTLFQRSIDNFPVYLLTGRLLFGFFSQCTKASMKSIISSAKLIKKIYIPKYIISLSNVIANFLFFLISLVALIIIMLATRAPVSIYILYVPYYLITLFFFSCGVSLFLSTLTVFFRDLEHIYTVFLTVLMYASAIFYPAEIIPDRFRFILTINPLYHFIAGFRAVVYHGFAPEAKNLLVCFAVAVVSMMIGIIVFEKKQDRFILYL